jgi:hypothetical protein
LPAPAIPPPGLLAAECPRASPVRTGGTDIYRNAGEAALVEFGSTKGKLTLHLLGFSTGG